MSSVSALFTPFTVRGVTLRNRLWVAPMCQYSIDQHDGIPRDWHLVHLGALARGGAGLVIAEATAVSPEGRISAEDTGMWTDEQARAWQRIVTFIHSQGTSAGLQLAHAGRKASVWPAWGTEQAGTRPIGDGGWPTVSASAVPFPGYDSPVALTVDEIAAVVDDFASAARRAVDAGFDVLEIHAAHGYLLHQFLSPLSNLRTDRYGGSLANRARFLLEVIDGIRAVVADTVPLFVRFSATDYAPDGWNEEQTVTVAGWAAEHGADFFDISSGGNVTGVTIPLGPGYQVPLAEFVKTRADVAVSAVGLITTPAQAEEIVASGQADAVLLGRQLLRDPHFPLRAAHELGVSLDYWPPQYLRAQWRD
ncbi:NADH:flavin oxidoreductase/NADH oxidase [Glaciibacter psychrotolerans]|uniref:2,4-dienoyl-CoA reductase-like NADH-dependent reductase (Old Yellow Enzyme family) n=1 Tax=Glaciibacter psychrotolerans TaxID=670054 RepID=A0A7Z0EEH5_9MICO|nr:NADH:flavin oxidoreductase/NADH oxidase [Leifsonia psychrotolerans]NYJ20178.1 2,4-dienoyl-CoA reductase-like NADH-dependent reductase (Old Yellow Enzyme family) [Leifsonia psychrotolerans]